MNEVVIHMEGGAQQFTLQGVPLDAAEMLWEIADAIAGHFDPPHTDATITVYAGTDVPRPV